MNNSKRIQRLSTNMRTICSLAMFVIPLVLAWIWLDFTRFAAAIADSQGINIQMQYIGPMNLLFGFLISMLPAGVIIYGLQRLRKLFALYQQNIFFSTENIKHLRAFSTALFISVLLSPVTTTLLGLALTMSNPPGEKSLVIMLSSHEISTGFIAVLFMVISGIMVEAKKLADENSEII